MAIEFQSSISGVQSAFTNQGVRAHNVANVNTKGFQAKNPVALSDSQDKPKTYALSTNQTGYINSTEKTKQQQELASTTDLNQEIPEQMSNEYTVKANLSVIKTTDQMLGDVIDLLG